MKSFHRVTPAQDVLLLRVWCCSQLQLYHQPYNTEWVIRSPLKYVIPLHPPYTSDLHSLYSRYKVTSSISLFSFPTISRYRNLCDVHITYICFPAKINLCWLGGIPSFCSTFSFTTAILNSGSMSISISLPARLFTLSSICSSFVLVLGSEKGWVDRGGWRESREEGPRVGNVWNGWDVDWGAIGYDRNYLDEKYQAKHNNMINKEPGMR